MADCARCGQPIGDTAYLCRRELAVAHRLRDAADLVPEMTVTVLRLARLHGPTPRTGRLAPSEPIRPDSGALRHYADQVKGWPSGLPVDLRASDDADSVRNTATTWARHIAGETGADPPSDTAGLLRWLADRLDWCRYRQWAPEAFGELDDAAALVTRVVDSPPSRTRVVVGPCPELPDGVPCVGRVVAVVPADLARPAWMGCPVCGTRWDTTMWARAGRRIQRMMDGRVEA